MTLSKQTKLIIALGLVYFIWGSTFLGVKVAMKDFPPMLLSGLRFFTGGLILLAFSLARGQSLPKLELWKGAAIIGFLLTGIGNSSVANAIKYMPSGVAALLVATIPAWMLLLDFMFFTKSKPSTFSIIGLVLGFLGMAILLNPFGLKASVPFWPTFLIFVGSISWAYGSLLSPTLKTPTGIQSTAIQMLTGGLLSLLISFFTESNQLELIKNAPAQSYLAMAYLVFIGSFMGYSAYNWLINNTSSTLVATYAYVNPVVAIFLGWFFINEKLSLRELVASAVILFGVVMMTLGRKKTN